MDKDKICINSLGLILKEARDKKNITIEELVFKANHPKITKKNIIKWEKGKGFPNLDEIYKLSEFLDLNPNKILDLKHKIQGKGLKKPNESTRRMGDRILKLSRPGFRVLIFFIEVIAAICVAVGYKFIHFSYENMEKPVQRDFQVIVGNYTHIDTLNETNNTFVIEK